MNFSRDLVKIRRSEKKNVLGRKWGSGAVHIGPSPGRKQAGWAGRGRGPRRGSTRSSSSRASHGQEAMAASQGHSGAGRGSGEAARAGTGRNGTRGPGSGGSRADPAGAGRRRGSHGGGGFCCRERDREGERRSKGEGGEEGRGGATMKVGEAAGSIWIGSSSPDLDLPGRAGTGSCGARAARSDRKSVV